MQVPLTINDFLRRAEQVYPDRIGFVDEPDQPAPSWGSVTYADVAGRARAHAAALDRLGVGVGDRVAIVSHNSARLLTSFFGTSGSGRILVPVNFRLAAEEVRYIVEHSGARVLLIDPELEDALSGVGAEHRYVIGTDSDAELFGLGPDGRATDAEPVPWEPDETATAVINYTSGTTARPKGVEQTHRSLWLNATVFGWQAGIGDRDIFLHTLPMFHCNGWGMPYANTGMGTQQVVIRKIDGAEILRRVEQFGVTVMCGAPAVVNMVLDAASQWDGPIPGHGRTRIIVAGAPPPTRTIERVEVELGWEFIQIYGLTETAPLLTMNRSRAEWDELTPAERATKLSRAGGPALGIEMAVDSQGEVIARGNHVMKQYWDQPDATDAAIVDGWFHTGDGGFVDDENYVTVSDRKKDVIITGGENVSSVEVEDALFSHPAVAEAAVIGVPDEKWGEMVMGLVVLAPGEEVSADELREHCRSRLAGYKVPKRIEFRDELARTATGKLQKFKLRQDYWSDRERQVN